MPPVTVLFPVRMSVPTPVLVNPWVPARDVAMAGEMLVVLTAIVGPPALLLLRVRMDAPPIVHEKVFVGLSNTSAPIVRFVSRLTVIGPVRFGVVKLAVL